MTKKKKEEKKKEVEMPKSTDTILPDYSKNMTNLTINASYVSGLQHLLMYLLSTSETPEQITEAYAKINKLESTKGKDFDGEPFTAFEECLWIILNITSYLRYEMISQKAYLEADVNVSTKDVEESMQKLFLGDPADFDTNAKEIQDKLYKAIEKSTT